MSDAASPSGGGSAESDCRRQALKYLARREYGVSELGRKLRGKGFPGCHCDKVVEDLAMQKLVSDKRYAESVLNVRVRKGYGPARIQYLLNEAGVDKGVIDEVFGFTDVDWLQQLKLHIHKKYGDTSPESYLEWVRRARYLNARGYGSDLIKEAMAPVISEAVSEKVSDRVSKGAGHES